MNSIINANSTVKDLNIGIALIGCYFIFEFGSIQGLYPVINQLKLPFVLSLSSILYAVYICLAGKLDFRSGTTKSFVFLCLFIMVYSALSTKDELIIVDNLKLFSFFIAQYIIIVSCVKKTTQFFLLIDIWLASILFSSYHGIMQGGLVWGNRWLKDENHISILAAIAIPFAFILFKHCQHKLKIVFYTICLFFFVTVNLVAASRGGVLSMIIAGLLCLFIYGLKFRNLLIVITSVTLVFSFAPDKFFKEMKTLEQGTKEETAKDRLYLWGIAIQMFNDNPVIGVGPMNYPVYFWFYEKGNLYSEKEAFRVAHSTPVQWIAETGIIGSLIMLMLQKSLFSNWKTRKLLVKRNSLLFANNKDSQFIINMSHACGISQIAFWTGACFLSLLPYPFYWCLIPFSEAWKNISLNYFKSLDGQS